MRRILGLGFRLSILIFCLGLIYAETASSYGWNDELETAYLNTQDQVNYFPVVECTTVSSDVKLKKRTVPKKPIDTKIRKGHYPDSIILKFIEESDPRYCQGVTSGTLDGDLKQINRLLESRGVTEIRKLFTRPDYELDEERIKGQELSGQELADLNLYHLIKTDSDKIDTEGLINSLNSFDVIEIAYPEPIPQPAMVNPYDIPPATPSYVWNQYYLGNPPQGIGAQWAWANYLNTRGEGIKLVDIEGGWNFDHEDLPLSPTNLIAGTNSDVWKQHGTAVAGELVGVDNNYGITGIASNLNYAMISIMGVSGANAVSLATANTNAGDIILIEWQIPGPGDNSGCICNCTEYQSVPAEWEPAVFEAIKTATSSGRIVIEAAGNGSMNLDDLRYENLFDRDFIDSGAIVVGAGYSSDRSPECWTNFGSRVDVQGRGDSVMTTGYNCYVDYPTCDPNQFYTNSFSGTSSASPIVAGATAIIQGYLKRRGFTTGLSPSSMRKLLIQTGTPQTGINHIGPLPDLTLAIPTTLTPYIRILGKSPWYNQIQSAYDAAGDGDIIQSQQFGFPENLTFDLNKSVSLEGGYDAIYDSSTPYFTVVQGSLTISAGTIVLGGILIF